MRYFSQKIYVIFFCLLIACAPAQQKADSLQALIRADKDDTGKVSHLLLLSREYDLAGVPDEALEQAQAALKLARQLDSKVHEARALIRAGNIYKATGRDSLALAYYNSSIKINGKLAENPAGETEVKRANTGLGQAYGNIASVYLNRGNYDKVIENSDISLEKSRAAGDKAQEARTLNNLGSMYFYLANYAAALDKYKQALQIAKEDGNKYEIALKVGNIGIVYSEKGDYPEALTWYFEALKIAEEISNKELQSNTLANIGGTYTNQGNYEKALETMARSLKLKEEISDLNGIASTLGNMGGTYIKQKKYQAALDCYTRALKISRELKDRLLIAGMLGNIGLVYSDLKNNGEALKYYEESLAMSREIADKNGEAVTLGLIGSLLERTQQFQKAFGHIYRALALADSVGAKYVVKGQYQHLSDLYQNSTVPLRDTVGGKMLNLEQMRLRAKYYYERYISVRDIIINEENTEKTVRTEMNYEFAKKEAVAKAEQDKKEVLMKAAHQRKQVVYVSIILILIISIIAAFLFINRQKLLRQKNEVIFAQQQALLEAEKLKAEEELAHARNLLFSYTNNLIEKNTAIEEYQREIEKLKNLKSAEIYSEKIETLDDLNKSTLLTNDDWEKFKDLFEQVYKGFFVRLKDKFPALTNAETRLVSLVKLNLDNRQMANMLGVSPETITKTKYRLRKKINLPESQDIDQLVESI